MPRPASNSRRQRRSVAAPPAAAQAPLQGQPPQDGSYQDWLLLLGIVVAVFAVYAFTAPRTVTLEDDGLFIMASVDAGVAHPPGYPLYTILGHVASWLPVGTPALRVHLLSGLLGALACAALFLVARHTGVPRWCALAAALAYGVSEHFWSQAIIAEVYTLNVLLTLLVLLLCLRAAAGAGGFGREPAVRAAAQPVSPMREPAVRTVAKPGGSVREPAVRAAAGAGGFGRDLALAAFCFGLGLANHWPLTILAAPAFAILLWPRLRQLLPRLPMLLAMALGTAAALYLWMAVRSWQPGIIAFYGPIASAEDFWYYISRSGYGSVDTSPSAGLLDKALFAWYFLKESFFLLTPVGALLALYGLYHLHRTAQTCLLAATAWIYCAHSLLLILALGFDYEYLNVAVFRPYPLLPYAIVAYWMAQGLAAIATNLGAPAAAPAAAGPEPSRALKRLTKILPARWIPASAGMGVSALALLLPALVFHKNLPINDRSQDRFAETYGRMILDNLAENAVLFVVGDTTTAPLGYLHYAEGVRPDVQLINTQGLVYPTRLFVPPVKRSQREGALADFMRANTRPVYTINKVAEIPNPDGTIHHGFYQKIDPQGEPESITLLFSEPVTDYFEALSRSPLPKDRWNRHQHSILLQQYGNFLGYTILSDNPALKSVAEDKVQVMENQYYGLVDMAEVLIEHGYKQEHFAIATTLLEKAEPLADETLSKNMRGRHHYRRGFLAYRLQDFAEARRQFQLSTQAHDHPDNPSHHALTIFQPGG